jgi:RimJ/RimL family protein N-acetyltransferase
MSSRSDVQRPVVVEPVVLAGRGVRLEPLSREAHFDGVAAAIRDGDLAAVPYTFVPHVDDLDAFFADAARALDEGRELGFATVDTTTGAIAGSTRFRMIEATHRRAEIGFTFVAAGYQRSHVNTGAKLLMLEHAFDTWGLNRVELLTDALNDRSRAAITRIGARQEGILRAHMVMRDGRIRDSVIYSITAPEWPAVRAALQARLREPAQPE